MSLVNFEYIYIGSSLLVSKYLGLDYFLNGPQFPGNKSGDCGEKISVKVAAAGNSDWSHRACGSVPGVPENAGSRVHDSLARTVLSGSSCGSLLYFSPVKIRGNHWNGREMWEETMVWSWFDHGFTGEYEVYLHFSKRFSKLRHGGCWKSPSLVAATFLADKTSGTAGTNTTI